MEEEKQGKTRAALVRAGAVCFDVDSTVCTFEGIDELARHCNTAEAVAEWYSFPPPPKTCLRSYKDEESYGRGCILSRCARSET